MERSVKYTLILTIFVVVVSISSSALINGGHYRIRSMLDGLYATAGDASFFSEMGMDLGNITTEKWGNFREQRWNVIGLDQTGKEYWLFSQEYTFNRLSASIKENKPNRHICELVPVDFNKFLIRSSETGLCLHNPGYGQTISGTVCDEESVSQRWEFDLLTPQ